MSGGPGIAELAEDGLRFVGESGRHHFAWGDMATWEVDGDAMWIKMNVEGGGGYRVEVVPDDGGLHRWVFLLPHNGVAQSQGNL